MLNFLGLTKASKTNAKGSSCGRNAFMQFLRKYREDNKCVGKSACRSAYEAGQLWARMTLNDKYVFIKAAREAGYVYNARNRRMNGVLSHLRRSLPTDKSCNLGQLCMAVKKMQSWKRSVWECICATNQ